MAVRDVENENRERPAVYDAAMRILASGDNSRRMLREKLTRKGYSPDEIAEALDALERKGYISDARLMERYAAALAAKKSYGAYRIGMEIRRRFDRESVDAFLADSLADIDFAANAVAFAQKNAPRGRDYLLRRMQSLGYTSAEIVGALKTLSGGF